jgi:hypothetical protein
VDGKLEGMQQEIVTASLAVSLSHFTEKVSKATENMRLVALWTDI